MTFSQLACQELKQARRRHAAIHSAHEGYAVILEELDEFWQEVRQRDPNSAWLLRELVQIAAMAQRTAEDLSLTPPQ